MQQTRATLLSRRLLLHNLPLGHPKFQPIKPWRRHFHFSLRTPLKSISESDSQEFDRYAPIGALTSPGHMSIAEEEKYLERVTILRDFVSQDDISPKEKLEACEELFEMYSKLCQIFKATGYLQEALELRKEIYGPISEQVLQALRKLRDTLNVQKRTQEALTTQFQVITLMAKLVNVRTDSSGFDEEQIKSSQKFAPEWFIVGDLYFKLSQFTHARDAFQRCSSILTKLFTRHDLMTRCHVRLGFVHYKLQQYKEAVDVFEKEANKPGEMEKVFSDALELSDLYLNLGNACMYLKTPQKAELYFRRAIDTIKNAWKSNKDSSNNLKLGELLYSLAVVYTSQHEQFQLASTIINDSLQIFYHELEKSTNDLTYNNTVRQHICQCLMTNGVIYQLQKDDVEAERLFRQALEIVEPLTLQYKEIESDLPVNYCRDVGFVHLRLAEILRTKGSYDFVDLYKQAIDMMNKCKDVKQIRHLLAECHKEYGTYLFKEKEFDKAKEHLQKSYQIFSDIAVLDFDPDLGHVSRMLGDLWVPKNDLKKAVSYYDEAVGLLMLQEKAPEREQVIKECLDLMKRTGDLIEKGIEEKQQQIESLETGKIMDGEARVVLRKDKLSSMKLNLESERKLAMNVKNEARTKEKILEMQNRANNQ